MISAHAEDVSDRIKQLTVGFVAGSLGAPREAKKKKKGFGLSAETLGITGRDGVIRTLDPLHPMQVRYQAALRPDLMKLYQIELRKHRAAAQIGRCWVAWCCLSAQEFDNAGEFGAQRQGAGRQRRYFALRGLAGRLFQPVAGAADGKAFLVQQFADAAHQQHFVMLVLAAVAAPFDRPELGEFLLPVTQHMRFDAAQFADLAYREIAFGRDRRQDVFTV